MVNLRNRSTPRLLTVNRARPHASVPFVSVLRLALMLSSGPVVKIPTVRYIDIDLVHFHGKLNVSLIFFA